MRRAAVLLRKQEQKAQKESVYKETIELTTVEGDHNLEATRIKKLWIRW